MLNTKVGGIVETNQQMNESKTEFILFFLHFISLPTSFLLCFKMSSKNVFIIVEIHRPVSISILA